MQIGRAIQNTDVVIPRERTQDTKQANRFLTGQLVEWQSLNFSQLTARRKNIKAILNRDREVIPRDLRRRVRSKQPRQPIVDTTVGNAKSCRTMGLSVQINQKNTLAGLGKFSGQLDGGGGLATSAFLIHDRNGAHNAISDREGLRLHCRRRAQPSRSVPGHMYWLGPSST